MLTPFRLFELLIFLLLFPTFSVAMTPEGIIDVSVSRARVYPGDVVEFELRIPEDSGEVVHAILLQPSTGETDLTLHDVPGRAGAYRGKIKLAVEASAGMYIVHAWAGERKSPRAVGKATFLLGQLITDYFVASYVDQQQPAADISGYVKDFRSLGGNFLIAHGLITPDKAFYPSKICRTDVTRGSEKDIVELVLSRADAEGVAVLLSVSWDMTKRSHFKDRMGEIRSIMREMYALYRHHPSLAGFYSYQEGSGTYYVPYVREFSFHVKSLDMGLLSACAPHVDDPLLAGYLSTVEELDIIIYQSGTMASYRTDNRKLYPRRRVRDFCALGAGAKRLQEKIAINHVEMFAYMEKRQSPQIIAASYDDIYRQILSAATVSGADGISLFSYHAHIYAPLKKFEAVGRSRDATAEGLKAYGLITSKITLTPNPLSVYFPYSDWIIERWPNYFLPALDALRVAGTPVDVLPYAPPLEESIYPYYPFHMNEDVLKRLLKERTVLILPNISGFQQTDSDLIKAFVEQGGVVVAFGPQIPMGRSYERRELFGAEEAGDERERTAMIVKDAIGGHVKTGARFALSKTAFSSWTANGARVIATFEDGAAAALINKHGRGTVVTIIPDAWTAAKNAPEFVRDCVEYAMSAAGHAPLVDVTGLNERTDLVLAQTSDGFRLAVVNHNETELEVTLKPHGPAGSRAFRWLDLEKGGAIGRPSTDQSLRIKVPGGKFRALEFHR